MIGKRSEDRFNSKQVRKAKLKCVSLVGKFMKYARANKESKKWNKDTEKLFKELDYEWRQWCRRKNLKHFLNVFKNEVYIFKTQDDTTEDKTT